MSWMRITTRLWIISALIIALFAGLGIQSLWRQEKIRHLTLLIALIGFIEIGVINLKIFSRPIEPEKLPVSFYSIIKSDHETSFRVYCTTGCFSLQRLGELGIFTAQGNNPVQLKASIDLIAAAGGYEFNQYIPIIPPYPTFESQPQPSAELFEKLNTKYIVSPYPLTDKNLSLIYQEGNFLLYQNNLSKPAESSFYSAPRSLRIGLILFGLTWVGLAYAYRHPQFLLRPRRARR